MKYTFINSSNFKNGLSIPLYQVFDGEQVQYEAIVFGTSARGTVIKSDSLRHINRSKVVAWREAKGREQRK